MPLAHKHFEYLRKVEEGMTKVLMMLHAYLINNSEVEYMFRCAATKL